MNKSLAAFAVATALVVAPSFAAEPPLTNPESQMENLTLANVSEILTELGAQNVEQHDSDGKKIVTFIDRGTPFNMGVLCVQDVCSGLVMIVALSTGTTKYPLELVNSANKENMLVSVTQLDPDKIGIGRVLITEGGVTKKNLALNIVTFVGAVHLSIKYMTSQLVAGYQQGGSAQYLRAGMGTLPPRPVFLSKREMAILIDAQRLPRRAGTLHR